MPYSCADVSLTVAMVVSHQSCADGRAVAKAVSRQSCADGWAVAKAESRQSCADVSRR